MNVYQRICKLALEDQSKSELIKVLANELEYQIHKMLGAGSSRAIFKPRHPSESYFFVQLNKQCMMKYDAFFLVISRCLVFVIEFVAKLERIIFGSAKIVYFRQIRSS